MKLKRDEIAERADLSEIAPYFREEALNSLVKRDAGFLSYAEHGNQYHVRIVSQNVGLLKALGIFEKALLEAFDFTRTNHRHDLSTLRWLFRMADPKKLRAAGKPLQGSGPFTIYRGVAGHGAARNLRGFSWSGSLGVAAWFADRGASMNLENPVVLRVVVPAGCVLAYLPDARQEDEYVVQVPDDLRLDRVPESVWRPEGKKLAAARKAADERERTEREHAECERRAALTPAEKAAEDTERRLMSRQRAAHCKKLNAQIGASFAEGHTLEEALATLGASPEAKP